MSGFGWLIALPHSQCCPPPPSDIYCHWAHYYWTFHSCLHCSYGDVGGGGEHSAAAAVAAGNDAGAGDGAEGDDAMRMMETLDGA